MVTALARALLANEMHRRESVRRLSRLRNAEHARIGIIPHMELSFT